MEGNLTTMINQDNPRSIKTKQDQPRSKQGQLNQNQSMAVIAFALLDTNPISPICLVMVCKCDILAMTV